MRADVYLAQNGYAKSRKAAHDLIAAGAVLVDGRAVEKPSQSIPEAETHRVEITRREAYVSRGGLKLAHALAAFSVDVTGLVALDIGASTGGFTDCLLQNGAAKVFAVDSGSGQLDPSMEADERVISMPGRNARYLRPEDLGEAVQIAVADVSFISQTHIIPVLPALLDENGIYLCLIKPQFEAGRAALNKHGIVKSPRDRVHAIERVLAAAGENGLSCVGLTLSPIQGGDGNIEYLACFDKSGRPTVTGADIQDTVGRSHESSAKCPPGQFSLS